MTTKQSFLAAILENPKDDDLRLVYADFLDDNGEAERGELIRLQIELPKHTDHVFAPADAAKKYHDTLLEEPCRVCQMICRERQLLHTYRRSWEERECFCLVINQVRNDPDRLELMFKTKWERGFVNTITCDGGNFLEHADELVSRLPLALVLWTSVPDPDLVWKHKWKKVTPKVGDSMANLVSKEYGVLISLGYADGLVPQRQS